MMWMGPQPRPSRLTLAFGAAVVVIALAWLFVRASGASAPVPAYALQFGTNVVRNLASLAYFALSGPREALRFMMVQPSAIVGLWGVACVVGPGRRSPDARPTRVTVSRTTTAWDFFRLRGSGLRAIRVRRVEFGTSTYVSFALIAYALLAGVASHRAARNDRGHRPRPGVVSLVHGRQLSAASPPRSSRGRSGASGNCDCSRAGKRSNPACWQGACSFVLRTYRSSRPSAPPDSPGNSASTRHTSSGCIQQIRRPPGPLSLWYQPAAMCTCRVDGEALQSNV